MLRALVAYANISASVTYIEQPSSVIVRKKPAAAVTWANATASFGWANPAIVATWARINSTITWQNVVVAGIDVQVQSLDRFFVDEQFLIDVHSISYEKVISDSINVSDSIFYVTGILSDAYDAVTIDDNANLDSFIKNSTFGKDNVASVIDSPAFLLARPVIDSTTVFDSANMRAEKAVFDTISMQESLTRNFAQGLSESLGVGDSPAIHVNIPSIADSVSVTDSVIVALTAAQVSLFNINVFNAFQFNE